MHTRSIRGHDGRHLLLAAIVAAPLTAGAQDEPPTSPMTFFVTSEQSGGDLGGLAGADATCERLAEAAGATGLVWHAYLSTHGTREQPAVHARDRIGEGPWHNAEGVRIADDVDALHGDTRRDSNVLMQDTALTEAGDVVSGRNRAEGTANEHDMLTGSDTHGRAFAAGTAVKHNLTCDNWTSDSPDGSAMVGHHDRMSSFNTSWNSSHATLGCSLESFAQTGGSGRFYCFADGATGVEE